MKEIQEEIKSYVTMYQASDGTKFHDEEECKKYELSAKGAVRDKLSKLIVSDTRGTTYDAWSIFAGCDDHEVIAVKMDFEKDFDTVLQFIHLEFSWYNTENKEVFQIIEKAFKEKDVVLFGITSDGDYYFINSRNNLIANINNFCNNEQISSAMP